MGKARCDARRRGGYAPRWADAEIESMVKEYLKGTTNHDIATLLNRSIPQVKGMISKIRKRRGLPFRDQEQINNARIKTISMGGSAKLTPTQFDKDWQGLVPRDHWLITKKWGVNKNDAE